MNSDWYADCRLLLPLRSDTRDRSAQPNGVKTAGVTIATTALSHYGKAGQFSGAQQLIVGPADHLDLGSSDWTIGCRFATTQTVEGATLFTREWTTSPYTGGVVLQLNTGGRLALWWADWSTGGPFLTASVGGHTDGAAHRVDWVRIGTSHYLLLDGAEVASRSGVATNMAPSLTGITIGNDRTFGPRFYTGLLWDVSVFARAIPQADLIAAGPLVSPVSNLGTTAVLDDAGQPAQRIVQVAPRAAGSRLFSGASDAAGRYAIEAPAVESNVLFLDDAAGTTHDDIAVRVTA